MSSVSKEVEENYTVLRALGDGKFGQVSKVEHKVTKKHFAWKQLNLEEDPLSEAEARILRSVNHGNHQNIVKLHEVFVENGVMDLMLELCKCSMADHIDSRLEDLGSMRWYHKPSTSEICKTMVQLLGAVSFLHENQVAHRDIKPANVLKGAGGHWKLADFNLACEFHPSEAMSQYAGTPPYIAPEVEEKRYTEKCDLYSLGVLFMALVFGKEYVRAEFWDSGVPKGLLSEQTWHQHESLTALSFAKKLLAPEVERYDAEGALKSPLLSRSTCCTIC